MDRYDQSDRALSAAKTGLTAKVVAVALLMAIVSVMMWVQIFQNMPNAKRIDDYGWQWIISIAFTVASVLLPIGMWHGGMLKIWQAYDIKMIRNQVCENEEDEELQFFAASCMLSTDYNEAPSQPYYAPPTQQPPYAAPAPQAAPASDTVVCQSCGAMVSKSAFCGRCGSPM